jgi:hypothetical protein
MKYNERRTGLSRIDFFYRLVIWCDMWNKIELPYLCERIIAFSIPENDTLYVMSYEGIHQVTLAPDIKIRTDEEHAEDYELLNTEEMTMSYGGKHLKMLGLHGGRPITINNAGEKLKLDRTACSLSIKDSTDHTRQTIQYTDLSGDWAIASYSADRKYLLIGTPYELHIFHQ